MFRKSHKSPGQGVRESVRFALSSLFYLFAIAAQCRDATTANYGVTFCWLLTSKSSFEKFGGALRRVVIALGIAVPCTLITLSQGFFIKPLHSMLFVEITDIRTDIDLSKVTHVEETTKHSNDLAIPGLNMTAAIDFPVDIIRGVRIYFIGGEFIFIEGWKLSDWKKLREAVLKQVQSHNSIVKPLMSTL